MSEVVGEGVIRIRTDETGVDYAKSGKQAGAGFSGGFKSSLKGLGLAVGGALAAAGVGKFFAGAISGASDLQETLSKTSVVFGKAGDDVIKFSERGAAALGLTQQQALDAASTFGVFGKAAGLTGPKLSGFSTDLTSLAVDLASFHNASPEEVIEALGAGLRGEAEPLRRFGILMDDASLKAEAMRQGLIKNTKEALTPQVKTLAAQGLIFKQTADAQGDFERTSGGLANQQRILSATFKDLQTTIGKALLPAVLTVVKGLNSLLGGASVLQPVIDRVGEALAGMFAGGGEASGFFNSLKDAATDALPIIRDVILTQVLPAVQELITSLRDNFGPVLAKLGTLIETTILPMLAKLGQFIISDVLPLWRTFWTFVSTVVIPLIATLADFVITQLIPPFLSLVQTVATKLAPVFRQLSETIATKIVPAAQRLVEQIRTQLIPAITPLVQKLITVGSFFVKLSVTVLSKVLPPLIRLAGFIITKVVPAVVTIITKVAQFVNGLINFVGAVGRAVAAAVRFASTLIQQVDKAVSAVVSAITSLPGKIIALGGKMLAAGKSLMGKLFDGIKSAATGVGGVVGNVASAIGDAVKGALNDVIQLFNNAIPDKIEIKFAPDIDLPNDPIPYLARGVRDFSGGLAVVGEQGPELVRLPAGADVFSNAESRKLAAQDGAGDEWIAKLTAALVTALAAVRPVTVVTDAEDPAAVAMQVINRLATA